MAVADKTPIQLAQLAPEEFGYYLGEPIRPATGQPLYAAYDQATRVVGPMGSGKTFRFLARTVRRHPGPGLFGTSKQDLVEWTYGARRKRGPVVALDAQDVCPGLEPMRWSPIHGAEDTQVASVRAAGFVAGGNNSALIKGHDGNDGAASYYRQAAASVLECLLHAAALDGATLRDVLKWAARFDDPTPRMILDRHPGAGPGWADRLVLATTGDDRKVTNTSSTLAQALDCLKHEEIVDAIDVSRHQATDIEQMILQNGSFYMLGKDDPYLSIRPLLTAMAEDILDRAEKLAFTMPHRRLDPPFLLGLDEVKQAPLPSLTQRVADGRGRGLCVIYILQGWAQAEAAFGRNGAAELDSFTNNTIVFGGEGDTDFLERLEKRCGVVRVIRTSVSSSSGPNSGPTQSASEDWLPVLRAHEIGQLGNVIDGEALLLAGSLPPVLTRFPKLSEDEDWPDIEREIAQVRAMADAAKARTDAAKRRRMQEHAAAWAAMKGEGSA